MLYLIGGAARSGKTILTQRLFHEHRVPYFCLDAFVSTLEQAAPALGILSDESNLTRNPKLWPLLYPLLRDLAAVEPVYAFDGDALWPRGVAELIQSHPSPIRACFLGFANTTPERKLAEIRSHPDGVNDWIQKHDDDYILRFMEEMIEYSRFLEEECRVLKLPYVDVSQNFCEGIDRAFRLLAIS